MGRVKGLRILGGQRKGKVIESLPGKKIRPLLSRIRKSLFDILGTKVKQSCFLDLYAGLGSVGLEALSRGARQVIFVERDYSCVKILQNNLKRMSELFQGEVITGDVFSFQGREDCFDIIFLGPPYKEELVEKTLDLIKRRNWLKTEGWVIAQHHYKEKVPDVMHNLQVFRQRRYGNTVLTFYRYV